MIRFRILVTATLVAFASNAQAADLEGTIVTFLGQPTIESQQLVRHNRSQIWPNIVVAMDGSVLATYGRAFGGGEPFDKNRRHVALRRSEDGGKTWGEEIIIAEPGFQGGGTIVDEATGEILAFVEATLLRLDQ